MSREEPPRVKKASEELVDAARKVLSAGWDEAYHRAQKEGNLPTLLQEAAAGLDPDLRELVTALIPPLPSLPDDQIPPQVTDFLQTAEPGPAYYTLADGLAVLDEKERNRYVEKLPGWMLAQAAQAAEKGQDEEDARQIHTILHLLVPPDHRDQPVRFLQEKGWDEPWEKLESAVQGLYKRALEKNRQAALQSRAPISKRIKKQERILHTATYESLNGLPGGVANLANAVLAVPTGSGQSTRPSLSMLDSFALDPSRFAQKMAEYPPREWQKLLSEDYAAQCQNATTSGAWDFLAGRRYQVDQEACRRALTLGGDDKSLSDKKDRLLQRARRNRWGWAVSGPIALVLIALLVWAALQLPALIRPAMPAREETPAATPVVPEVVSTSPSPPEASSTAPLLTIKGELIVGEGQSCEAGTESWHPVTVRNTGQATATYTLILSQMPSGIQILHGSAEECPPIGQPIPTERVTNLQEIGPLKPGTDQEFVLLVPRQPPGYAAPEPFQVGLHEEGKQTSLDNITITPWDGQVTALLELGQPPSTGTYVRQQTITLPLTLTVNQPGQYQVAYFDGAGKAIGIPDRAVITDSLKSVEVECEVLTETGKVGNWQAVVYPLFRSGEPATAELTRTDFAVEDPRYGVQAKRVDYYGLIIGPSKEYDVGIGLVYEITNTGNLPVSMAITWNLGLNTEGMYQIVVTNTQGITHQLVLDSGPPLHLLSAPDQLAPCVKGEICPKLQIAVWIRTKWLQSIHRDKDNRIELTIGFMPDSDRNALFLIEEKIVESPTWIIDLVD